MKVLFKPAFLRTAAEPHLLQLQEVNSITSLSSLLFLFSLSSELLSIFTTFLGHQSVYLPFRCIFFSIPDRVSTCLRKDFTNVSSDCCSVPIANKLRVIVQNLNHLE